MRQNRNGRGSNPRRAIESNVTTEWIAVDEKAISRFWSKVRRGSDEECWEWLASCNCGGYGQMSVGRGTKTSHRISWEIANGKIKDGMCVLHHCDNPACVNPKHLFLGRPMDNYMDMEQKGRSVRQQPNKSRRKFSSEQVAEMRSDKQSGMTIASIAKKHGASIKHVQRVVSGKRRVQG
jgi:hypothetical protein